MKLRSTKRPPRAQRKLLTDIARKKLALNKLIATQRAEALGHVLGRWHRRQNDPLERANAFCSLCNMIAVAGVHALDPLAEPVYGHAVSRECSR